MYCLILIFSFLCLSVSGQICTDYHAVLKKVDKNYAEFSQSPFPNYIKFAASAKDTLKVRVNNSKGEIVYQNNFFLGEEGTYIMKFYNKTCPGIYFVHSETSNRQSFTKAVSITSDEPSEKKTEIRGSGALIRGAWEKSYAQKYKPPIQPDAVGVTVEYNYRYAVIFEFSSDHLYKITSERTDEANGSKEIRVYSGEFFLNSDSLMLYENGKLFRTYQYKVEDDTLTLSNFATLDKRTGITAITMEGTMYGNEIKLSGKYFRKKQR